MLLSRLLVPLVAVLLPFVLQTEPEDPPKVPVKSVAAPSMEYFGHSCVRIESPKGVKILIDPYGGGGFPVYQFPDGPLDADLILVTHLHSDHDFGGNPNIQKRWGERITTLYDGEAIVGDVVVKGVVGRHSTRNGNKGIKNVVWVVEVAGLRIAHWGDNEPVSEDLANRLGDVDILLLPVDAGHHLLSDDDVAAIIDRIQPRAVVPTHYRILSFEPDVEFGPDTDWESSGFGPVDPWLSHRDGVVRLTTNAVPLKDLKSLPDPATLVFQWPVNVAEDSTKRGR